MPHHVRHRSQHCVVRQTLTAVANGQKSRGRPRKCEAKLGCTIEQLVEYLGFQPNETRHLDHIVPLSQGGSEHFTNLRLLDGTDHMHRKSKPTSEEVAAVAMLQIKHGHDRGSTADYKQPRAQQ